MTNARAQSFNHLLITKFNIATTLSYGPFAQRLDDDWLRGRLAEFETFCLPSVKSQVGASFRWLILCDEESPQWFKDRMLSQPDVFTPLFVTGMTNATMGRRLAELGYIDERPLLTTRLDSDDAISRDFLATVQQQYAGQDRLFIEFPLGLRSFRGALFSALWRSAPFLTLIEAPHADGSPYDIVYIHSHDQVWKKEKTKAVWGKRYWIRSMHDRNSIQSATGIPRLSPRHERFDIDWDRLPPQPALPARVGLMAWGYWARLQRSKKYNALKNRVARVGGRPDRNAR
jgi:hypothetical protein